MQTSAIPWKIKCDFNTLPTLFHGETLPYKTIAHVCHCSHEHLYLENNAYPNANKYRCAECGNQDFFDANYFLKSSSWYEPIETLFPEEILYALEPIVFYDTTQVQLTFRVSIAIPYTINPIRNKIHYKDQLLFELSIDRQGVINQSIHVNFDLHTYSKNRYNFEELSEIEMIEYCDLLKHYKTKILHCIQQNKMLYSLEIPSACTSLEHVAFFIKYPHLKSFEFIYWQMEDLLPNHTSLTVLDALNFINPRKEKSLKKALFQHYSTQRKQKKPFLCHYIYALLRYIKDPNIIVQIIDLSLDIRDGMLSSHKKQKLWKLFFTFLTSHFDEKRIAHLLKQFSQEEDYWLIDTIELLNDISYFEKHENIHFQENNPLRANYKEVHDYVVHIHSFLYKKTLSHQTFTYTHKELAPCIQTEIYSVNVPYTRLELLEWGEKMHNCLAGYDRAILSKNKLIYGFFKEDELIFAIEMQEHKIVQAKSKYNTELLSVEKDFLNSWFEQFFKVNNK